MQVANFRQGIISPLDDESCIVCHGAFEGPVRVDYLKIPYNGFSLLWDEKLFEVLSKECDLIWLDEYEEEFIPPEKLDLVIKTLQKHQNKFANEYVRTFVKMLIDLITSAKERGHPVIFVL